MLTITVGESGNYHTIGEAVQAVPYSEPATIQILEGVYHEKLFIEKKNLCLKGRGMDKTIISFGDGANRILSDGKKCGTFRSQTVFLGGEHIEVSDMTIENSAGCGDVAGQALAVYADADEVLMENVRLSSRQDTLFLAPLQHAMALAEIGVDMGNVVAVLLVDGGLHVIDFEGLQLVGHSPSDSAVADGIGVLKID